MALVKKYLKTRPVCKVTFTLPPPISAQAHTVALVGDFNNWSEETLFLKGQSDGSFSVTVDLSTDQSFQFRYLIDGNRWQNDDGADAYTPTPFGNDTNSIVRT